jgi:hypothetical protein
MIVSVVRARGGCACSRSKFGGREDLLELKSVLLFGASLAYFDEAAEARL